MNSDERDRLSRLETSFEHHAREEREHFTVIMETLAEIKAEMANAAIWRSQVDRRHAIEDHDQDEENRKKMLDLNRRDVAFTGLGAGGGFFLFLLQYLGVLPA